MGTRHLQTVIDKNGVERVKQYGQWDGYPDGQGLDILKFLKGANLEKYSVEVEKINHITPEQDKMVDACKDWDVKYPYMSRDCGSRIHQLIQDGKVEFVYHHDEATKKWGCEGFYTIDLQKGTFASEYHGKTKTYKLNKLPEIGVYLRAMGVSKSTIKNILRNETDKDGNVTT